MNRKTFFALLALLASVSLNASAQDRYWEINDTNGITWKFDGRAHDDNVEMSGKRMSVLLRYGVDAQGRFHSNRGMVWPLLRTIPNDTHASLMRRLEWNPLTGVTVNKNWIDRLGERVDYITFDGTLTVVSRMWDTEVVRRILPSTEKPALIEMFTLTNRGNRKSRVAVDDMHPMIKTPASEGVSGVYRIEQTIYGAGVKELEPGESMSFYAVITAVADSEPTPVVDADEELRLRQQAVRQWMDNLVLDTPDETLNRMFAFSKIRSQESIYHTKGGPMHGPGGESYYAAIWANDQAEYMNPFFPFTGYEYGCQSALNSFLHFARFMNNEWRPIPSSIIAEGIDIWNGAGDRGDAAMIAYGASRYALARGSIDEARQLWPLIEWCLEYCHRKLNKQGVVTSDSDELENRFPSGDANLCTSSLYYDALISASYLARELGMGKKVQKKYATEARRMEQSIESYFHSNVQGYDTYQYYDGCTLLRSWICIPLTMGIFNHAEGTLEALYSDKLWTQNGMLTQQGSSTFWDRTTLYALRGALMAGDTERTIGHLQYYSTQRLLGNHVPYAIEAWPEGNQRHLAAESGLYGRVFTEGLFGIRPTGFRSFTILPRLPKDWPQMALRHVRICGSDFDIVVRRDGQKVFADIVIGGKTVASKECKGEKVEIRL